MKVTTGQQNAAIGYQALAENTSGNNSVAIGNKAGDNNTTGGNNISWVVEQMLLTCYCHSHQLDMEPITASSVFLGRATEKTVMIGDASFNGNVKIRGSLK